MSNRFTKKHTILTRAVCGFLAAVMMLPNVQISAKTPDVKPTVFGGTVLRGIVEEISDLPHSGEDNPNMESERGTARHPFVILEITGYKEQAEIGYLVGGCEPVRVEELFGTKQLKYNSVSTLGTAIVDVTDASDEIYFFNDEKEGSLEYYDDMTADDYQNRIVSETRVVQGYWEYVGDAMEQKLFSADGKESRVGTHVMVADDATRQVYMKRDASGGKWKWHTVNDIEINYNKKEYAAVNFKDVLDISKTYVDGDRIYTKRSNEGENAGTLYKMSGDNGYAYYKNKEIFLTESLGLSEKEALGYSVVVKTITSEDLNYEPEWIDYADLIYINPVSKNEKIADYFKATVKGKYINRAGLTDEDFSGAYKANIFEENDLDFSVVRRIFYKVSAEEDFAALLMDSDLYNLGASYSDYYTDATKKENIKADVYDWNLNRVLEPSYPEGEEAKSLALESGEQQLQEITVSYEQTKALANNGVTHSFKVEDLGLKNGKFKKDIENINGYFSILSSLGEFTVASADVTVNGSTFKQKLKFNATSSVKENKQKITFTTSDAATVKLICESEKNATVHIATVNNGKFQNAATIDKVSKTPTEYTLPLSEAGTYYVYSSSNSYFFYQIEVTEGSAAEVPTTPSTEATTQPTTPPTEATTQPTTPPTEATTQPTTPSTETPSVGVSGKIHNFTEHGLESKFYTIKGNLKKDAKASYGELKFTQALKLETATSITFEAKKQGTLALVTSGANRSIKLDGTAYTTEKDGLFKITLEAGKHEITKGDSILLYYMAFEEGLVLPDAGSTEPSTEATESSEEPPSTGADSEGTTAGNLVHNVTKNGLNNSFYKLSGDLTADKKYSTTYNYNDMELLLTKALKLNSRGSVSFKAAEDGALTLVFDEKSKGKSILINGKSYQVTGKTVEINVTKGTNYTIKQVSGNESRLFFLALEYGKKAEEGIGGGGTVEPAEPVTDGLSVSTTGCNNNVFKLCMMLVSSNPNLVKQIWFNNNLITSDGINLLQTRDTAAAEYWSGVTFKLARADMDNTTKLKSYYYYSVAKLNDNLHKDWDSADSFNQYGWHEMFTQLNDCYLTYVSNHVYAVDDNANGGLGIAKYFGSTGETPNATASADKDYFKKFDAFVQETYGEALDGNSAKPSYALRYVLDLDASEVTAATTLHVLDIEPTVSINKSLEQQWELKKSYIYMLVPDFAGEIKITHQTTAEFNSKSEDLNSTYDLIYFGTDYSGYNQKKSTMTVNAAFSMPSVTINGMFTDFNDDAMDGLIYFSLGDRMTSTEYRRLEKTTENKKTITYIERDRSTKYLVDESGNLFNSTELRFPGNDISDLKLEELEVYIGAGKPVVADKFLYACQKEFVQENCNVYKLVKDHKTTRDADNKLVYGGVYSINETERINEVVRENDVLIIFNEYPKLYDGTTKSGSAALVNKDVYLPVNEATGRSYLYFDFTVYAKNYGYRIYVDQDRNGKFEDDEIIVIGNAQNSKPTTYTYPLARSMVGLIQWKIEVYSKANEDIHNVISGCSAAKLSGENQKQKIKILQILPVDSTEGDDLTKNAYVDKYVEKLDHYDVTIVPTTLKDFQAIFKDKEFSFDMSKDISIGNDKNSNPKLDVLTAVESKKIGGHTLGSFNMIIVGFQDTYGEQDLDNSKGAVEYLQYYTLSGKSILYTHDLTSLYNVKAEKVSDGKKKETTVFGSTANTLLRDLMGMNRYKALSNQLTDRGMSLTQMRDFQNKTTYDEISSDAKHGYTYWAMRHLGWTDDYDTELHDDERMPFTAMIKVPGSEKYVTELNVGGQSDADTKAWFNHIEQSGFNNSNEITTQVKQLNKGQITEYPYKLSETITVAATHAQTYQLNLEDPEVTVWYCLSAKKGSSVTTSNDKGGDGTAVAYAANPMDGANNYYIYSKGNIFYSGVGHSRINNDEEAKLFVNTMIAAYRTAYEAAAVEILNSGVIEESGAGNGNRYTLQIPREFDNQASATETDQYTKEDFSTGTVQVAFTPKNYNFRNVMDCRIYYDGKDNITEIYYYDDSNHKVVLTAGKDYFFKNLMQGQKYYFDYPKKNLDNGLCDITFKVIYEGATEEGTTELHMTVQPLFQLD